MAVDGFPLTYPDRATEAPTRSLGDHAVVASATFRQTLSPLLQRLVRLVDSVAYRELVGW